MMVKEFRLYILDEMDFLRELEEVIYRNLKPKEAILLRKLLFRRLNKIQRWIK